MTKLHIFRGVTKGRRFKIANKMLMLINVLIILHTPWPVCAGFLDGGSGSGWGGRRSGDGCRGGGGPRGGDEGIAVAVGGVVEAESEIGC